MGWENKMIKVIHTNKITKSKAESKFENTAGWENHYENNKAFLDDYDNEVIDITGEEIQKAIYAESAEAFYLCEKIKSIVRVINKEKLSAGEWDSATFTKFLQSAEIQILERLLNQASLGSYKKAAMSLKEFYSEDQIKSIVGMVVEHEEKHKNIMTALLESQKSSEVKNG